MHFLEKHLSEEMQFYYLLQINKYWEAGLLTYNCHGSNFTVTSNLMVTSAAMQFWNSVGGER